MGISELLGNLKQNSGWAPCDGVASHLVGRTPSCFKVQKPNLEQWP